LRIQDGVEIDAVEWLHPHNDETSADDQVHLYERLCECACTRTHVPMRAFVCVFVSVCFVCECVFARASASVLSCFAWALACIFDCNRGS
jgi:hypothetical protein